MKRRTIDDYAHENEHELREVLAVVKAYRRSIGVIAMLGMLFAAVYSYITPNTYQSETIIAIKSENNANRDKDFFTKALEIGMDNIDDEVGLIKSRWIIFKALENLNIQTRYFASDMFQNVELYKNAPFIATFEFVSQRVKGPFELIHLSDNRFRLILKPTPMNWVKVTFRSLLKQLLFRKQLPLEEQLLTYDQVHRYDEPVVTQWFSLKVHKTHRPDNKKYVFYQMNDEQTYQFILKGLAIKKWSEFSEVIALKFTDAVPLRSTEILNTISQAYLQENLNLKTKSADITLNFLDMQLQAIEKTVRESAENLNKFKATNIIVDLGATAESTTQKLSELEKERYQLSVQQSLLESLLNYINSSDDLRSVSYGSTSNMNDSINDMIIKIQEAMTTRNALLVDFTELHPDVIKVTKQIIALRKSLIDSVTTNIKSIQKRKRDVGNMIYKLENALEALPGKERALAQLNRSFMVNEKIYAFLLQKRAETAIVQSSTVSNTRIVDSAVVPQEPIGPNRALNIVFGLVFGLLTGMSIAFLRNYLDKTIKSVQDIERKTLLPIYGVIPLLDSQNRREPFQEALRVVRTNLDFLKVEHRSKLVTVTSSVPSEGKSTFISELAKVIAHSGRKVLLIDLDMRRSVLHQKFKLDNSAGMSTLLSGRHTVDEVINKNAEVNLDIIAAGPQPPNPSELLMSKGFQFLIENLLKRYDYVLLDTPPIEVVTDALMLLQISDLTLFVMMANYSQKEFLENVNKFVRKYDLKNSGIVLNGVASPARSKYGYKYGYYHDKKVSATASAK